MLQFAYCEDYPLCRSCRPQRRRLEGQRGPGDADKCAQDSGARRLQWGSHQRHGGLGIPAGCVSILIALADEVRAELFVISIVRASSMRC